MLGIRTIRLASRAAVLVVSVVLASLLGTGSGAAGTDAAAEQGTVKLEWLGHLFYRLTSPGGVVV